MGTHPIFESDFDCLTDCENMVYPDANRPLYSPFFSVMGATSAMVFSAMGAAYGTAKSGVGIAAMAIMKPELIMRLGLWATQVSEEQRNNQSSLSEWFSSSFSP